MPNAPEWSDAVKGFDGARDGAGISYGGRKMEKIGSYYDKSFYDRTAQTKKDAGSARTGSAKKTNETRGEQKTPELSKAAQKLLKELHNTYGNMDFIVADYETEEEAASLLARGTSKYSALMSTDELEKMAADEDYKNKNLKLLDDAVSKLDDMKAQLGDKADGVKRLGVAIRDDGEVSFFAELEKNSEKQRERIEKHRQDKKEAAEEEKKADRHMPAGRTSGKRTTVFAPSVKELAEKIERVDWDKIKEEPLNPTGQRFDFTV